MRFFFSRSAPAGSERAALPASRLPGPVRDGLRVLAPLLLAILGVVLLVDRPGLTAEYRALGAPWEGRPYATTVSVPGPLPRSSLQELLSTEALFSVRWNGWWRVRRAGQHQFKLEAIDGAYLRIDGELVLNNAAGVGETRAAGRKLLTAGFHRVEAGLHRVDGEAAMTLGWVGPGATNVATNLPLADLYPGRPLLLRRLSRRILPRAPIVLRQLLGALLGLLALSRLPAAIDVLRGRAGAFGAGLRAIDLRRLETPALLGLFALTFVMVFPFTGTVRGGDDTSYLATATFGAKTWYYNRYCHVYLLKLFTFLSGGDPLVGVRAWWSFVLAATVASLAVAVRAVGRGLQIRTLGVTLFVLFSQPVLFGLIGAGFADYSAMMFVTAATALALHDIGRGDEQPAPGRRWIAFALGVLTVAATRSKEVGAILALLPLLYLVAPGPGLDLRRFARKLGWWLAGVATAQLAIMVIDAWLLDDFFFTINWNRLLRSNHLNFPSGVPLRGADWSRHLLEPSIRNLLLAVSAAAIWAGAARRRLERRLLHLLPISYVLALIALYVRLPHPFSTRMLIPILPVACLMAGLLLHDAGLDDVPWRTFFTPGVLLPGGIAAAGVLLLLVPYQSGDLDAASILPVDWLLRFGWTPEHFALGVLAPAALLAGVGVAALVVGRREGRVVAMLVVYCVLFGPGLASTQVSLAQHRAALHGDLLLYPWRVFRAELGGEGPISVVLSRDLFDRYRMSAHTRASLAKLVLRRRDVKVRYSGDLPREADLAIASPATYRAWRDELPALEATAVRDRNGFLVLVRPRLAVASQREPAPPP